MRPTVREAKGISRAALSRKNLAGGHIAALGRSVGLGWPVSAREDRQPDGVDVGPGPNDAMTSVRGELEPIALVELDDFDSRFDLYLELG